MPLERLRVQVWFVGEAGAMLRHAHPEQPLLITVRHGAPRVHMINMRLLGGLRVEGSALRLSECSVEAAAARSSDGEAHRRLAAPPVERALAIVGGSALLARTTLSGHAAGAILVKAASLTLVESAVRNCRAPTGAAMLVQHGANVTAVRSNLTDNRAEDGGGAIQVLAACARRTLAAAHRDATVVPARCCTTPSSAFQTRAQVVSGHVHLRNETLLERNVAPHGSAILLSPAATLEYSLPAPPGRWLYIRQGLLTFQLDQGHEDSDFPYACPNGVVGGPSPAEQSGPQCSHPW